MREDAEIDFLVQFLFFEPPRYYKLPLFKILHSIANFELQKPENMTKNAKASKKIYSKTNSKVTKKNKIKGKMKLIKLGLPP